MTTTPRDTYALPTRLLHWTIAALLLVQVPLAWIMTGQPVGPAKLGNYALHKSIGMLIFALVAIRLAARLLTGTPPLPTATPGWQRAGARLTQAVLYFVLFAMPMTGWLLSSAANMPVSVFALFTLPNLIPPDKAQVEILEEIHEAQGYLLFAFAGAHTLAALYHHFVRKDGVLVSMLFFVKRG